MRGEALNVAVSRAPQKFEVLFKDRMNQISQAVDLDVFVEPLGPGSPREVDDGAQPASPKADHYASGGGGQQGGGGRRHSSSHSGSERRASAAGSPTATRPYA